MHPTLKKTAFVHIYSQSQTSSLSAPVEIGEAHSLNCPKAWTQIILQFNNYCYSHGMQDPKILLTSTLAQANK